MPLWISVTLAAAVFQTIRFMLQKSLSAVRLSAAGATFARFFYSAPVILSALGLWFAATGHGLPPLAAMFWVYAVVGGTAQVLATICVVALFRQRNFAVGITFMKIEVILSVLIGLAVLGDRVSLAGFGAILLGVAGVLLLSRAPGATGAWWRHLTNRAAGLGLGSGLLFAVSAVFYRGATLAIDEPDPLLRAAITLATVVGLQTLGMAAWFLWRDRGELRAVWAARHSAVFIGLFSLAGSYCWFLAFTLQNAAYVKAVGQVELILGLAASVLAFREPVAARELTGIALLGGSILALVLTI